MDYLAFDRSILAQTQQPTKERVEGLKTQAPKKTSRYSKKLAVTHITGPGTSCPETRNFLAPSSPKQRDRVGTSWLRARNFRATLTALHKNDHNSLLRSPFSVNLGSMESLLRGLPKPTRNKL